MRRHPPPAARLALAAAGLLAAALLVARPAEATGWPQPPWGTGESRGEDVRIVLITFSPGDDIPSWFGHSAVLVEDSRLRAQRVYNYGMFSFGGDLLPKFLMGRLEFWVGEAPLGGTIRHYQSLDRDIRFQELGLSPERRLRLAKALADNVLPENRHYLYHHYDDNCATRIRDIIDEALDGQLRAFAERPARMTLRAHTRRHSQQNPVVDFILMLWMNDEIDRPITVWDEMFLPEEMERVFAEFSYVDDDGRTRPLVAESLVVYEASGRAPVPETPAKTWPGALLVGLLLGGGAVALAAWHAAAKRRLSRILFGVHNALVGLAFGLPGLLLFLMWAITEHTVTWRNENLLLASPVTFAALPLGIAVAAGSERAHRWLMGCWWVLAGTSVLAVALKILPLFSQGNGIPLALLVPMNLGFAAGWAWLKRSAPAQADAPADARAASGRKKTASHR
jgi:hypothetical protein